MTTNRVPVDQATVKVGDIVFRGAGSVAMVVVRISDGVTPTASGWVPRAGMFTLRKASSLPRSTGSTWQPMSEFTKEA